MEEKEGNEELKNGSTKEKKEKEPFFKNKKLLQIRSILKYGTILKK